MKWARIAAVFSVPVTRGYLTYSNYNVIAALGYTCQMSNARRSSPQLIISLHNYPATLLRNSSYRLSKFFCSLFYSGQRNGNSVDFFSIPGAKLWFLIEPQNCRDGHDYEFWWVGGLKFDNFEVSFKVSTLLDAIWNSVLLGTSFGIQMELNEVWIWG